MSTLIRTVSFPSRIKNYEITKQGCEHYKLRHRSSLKSEVLIWNATCDSSKTKNGTNVSKKGLKCNLTFFFDFLSLGLNFIFRSTFTLIELLF